MDWYYRWRLKRVRAEIAMLEGETRRRLGEDYTPHSRLRVLMRLAEGFEQRLRKSPDDSAPKAAAGEARA